jgi:hypothetical protein
MNPDKMRTEYGKLVYMLQDSVGHVVRGRLEFDCVQPVLTVRASVGYAPFAPPPAPAPCPRPRPRCGCVLCGTCTHPVLVLVCTWVFYVLYGVCVCTALCSVRARAGACLPGQP